jgi:hypothetical protein
MAGGALRMAELLAEHNQENFGSDQDVLTSASNPTAVEKQ